MGSTLEGKLKYTYNLIVKPTVLSTDDKPFLSRLSLIFYEQYGAMQNDE